jgi:transcriptional regulator with XRE-family HTH domain
MNQTGKLIRQAREKAGLTQREVSDRFGFTTSQFISNLERGLSPVPMSMIRKLSRILKISERDLVKTSVEDFKGAMLESMNEALR